MIDGAGGAIYEKKLKILDLFSGIGGFSLGLERTGGFETIGFCEIEPFCKKILNKHWPHIPIYEDIRKLDGSKIDADVIVGGYPCQPFSVAGKRAGETDDRHLWPEMYRLIKVIRPRWVIAENVAGHINMGLDQVLSDLEREGYIWWTFVIPACAVDAPHRRDRVWIVANADSISGRASWPSKAQKGAAIETASTSEQLSFISNTGYSEPSGWEAPETEHNQRSAAGIKEGGEPSSSCSNVADSEGYRFQGICKTGESSRESSRIDPGSRPVRRSHAQNVADSESGRVGEGRDSDQQEGGECCAESQSVGSGSDVADTEGDRLPRELPSGCNGEGGSEGSQPESTGGSGGGEDVADTPGGKQSGGIDGSVFERSEKITSEGTECTGGRSGITNVSFPDSWNGGRAWPIEPSVGRVANGIPQRVDRLKGLGNAVVPQIPEQIGYAILEAEA